MKKLKTLAFIFAVFVGTNSIAQCPPGQVNIEVEVTTDDWGYEVFWDLTPTGNGCGNGALFTFGNVSEVDCNGGGLQVATAGGYPDLTTTTETLGCLSEGICYDINSVDDYGDGGTDFVVLQNGIPSNTFVTSNVLISDTVFTFCVTLPPVNEAIMGNISNEYTKIPLSQSSNIVGDGIIQNLGSGDLTNVKLDIEVKKAGTTVHTATSTPQDLLSLATGSFSVTPYTPTSTGVYDVTATAILDQTDEVPANNVFTYSVEITDSVYARDNGVAEEYTFVGTPGAVANVFEIVNPIGTTSISQYVGNLDGSMLGASISMGIYSCDAFGIPDTLIATTQPAFIATSTGTWYHFPFSNSVYLTPGKYAFAAIETNTSFLSVGFGENFTPFTGYVIADGQIPWTPVDDFGFFSTFMIRANLNSVVGLNELETFDFTVHPNPATDVIKIPNVALGSKLEIINSLGQIVHTEISTTETVECSVAKFDDGVYTIRIANGSQLGYSRFIKK